MFNIQVRIAKDFDPFDALTGSSVAALSGRLSQNNKKKQGAAHCKGSCMDVCVNKMTSLKLEYTISSKQVSLMLVPGRCSEL